MLLQSILLLSLVGLSVQACDPERCMLPNCRCFNDTTVPGNIPKSEIPQIVMVSFEGVVNINNINEYRPLFASVTNPNDCPARGTFFIQDDGSDFKLINSLRIEGHEIGIQSVNGVAPTNSTGWIDTLKQVRFELESVGVDLTDIRGVRSPNQAHGGTEELIGLATNNMLYDSSCVRADASDAETFLWPYTYDYLPVGSCDKGKATLNTFPGKWEVPIADLHDMSTSKLPCTVPSSCRNVTTKSEAFNLFYNAFNDHYHGNRAPFLMLIDSTWAADPSKRDATTEFLQYIRVLHREDVWIVPIYKALQWIQAPVPNNELNAFAPWQCTL